MARRGAAALLALLVLVAAPKAARLVPALLLLEPLDGQVGDGDTDDHERTQHPIRAVAVEFGRRQPFEKVRFDAGHGLVELVLQIGKEHLLHDSRAPENSPEKSAFVGLQFGPLLFFSQAYAFFRWIPSSTFKF